MSSIPSGVKLNGRKPYVRDIVTGGTLNSKGYILTISAAPDNAMHPTADSEAFMRKTRVQSRLCAAGDAVREMLLGDN